MGTGTPRTAESVPGTTRVGYGRRPTRADIALTFGTLALMLTAVTLRQGHQEFPGPALLFFSVLAWLPLLKVGSDKVEKEDVLAGLTAVVTVRLAEPQFEGQTKEVLGTSAVRAIVAKVSTQS